MSTVWDCALPTAEKMVLLVIADHADDAGRNAWPSIATIARKASLSPRSAQRYVQSLVDRGLVDRDVQGGGYREMRHDRRPNRYTIDLDGVTRLTSRDGNGTTPEVVRDDTRVADGTTPVSPNPSCDPSQDPPVSSSSTATADDAAVDALPAVVETSRYVSDARRLCDLLADLMVDNGCRRPTISSAWIVDMERLIRLDGRTPEQIEAAIRWSQRHDFWSANIHSPGKLREKYDTLRLQARREQQAREPRGFAGIREFLANERRDVL